MITYQQEFSYTLRGEIESLIDQEWEEIGDEPDIKPDIDWKQVALMEEVGMLLAFTARDDGKLVGYCLVTKSVGLANKALVIAESQALFVSKEHRGGRVAINIIKFAEKCLKEDGVNRFNINSSAYIDLTPLMNRLGFKKIEVKFGRTL